MNESQDLHVVLGTGPLGQAVTNELLAREKSVRAVNRGGRADVPREAELVMWDLTVPEEARRAMDGASVVYACFSPPYHKWPELFPPLMRGFLKGLEATGARAVYADNLYMYGPVDGPLHEGLPHASRGPKGSVRGRMAELFLGANEVGRIRGTIARASDFYGPGVTLSALGERVFGNLLAGKAVETLGDPDQPHTYTFIEDFGRAMVTLGSTEESLGQVWHVPSAETLTTRELVKLVAKEAGADPRIKSLPRWLHGLLALRDPTLRELKETRYQFEAPFIVDHSRFQEAFGVQVTPHGEAVRSTIEWYRQRPS